MIALIKRIPEFMLGNRIATLWAFFLLVTFLASILILNPSLDPSSSSFSWPQLRLQFAYTPTNGDSVLQSWGSDGKDTYLRLIWIDLLFALSYGPFFAMLLHKMGASKLFVAIPLVEMVLNLTETSLEMYWVSSHTPENPMFAVFLTHSILATIKWALVPFYLVDSVLLIARAARRNPAPMLQST